MNRFLIVAVIVQILFYSVVVTGLYARLKFPDLTQNGVHLNVDSIVSAYVIEVFSGGFASLLVGLLVILGLISAGFSTIEGLIQSLSTTITTDIIKPLFGKNINENNYVKVNRFVILFLAVISFFVARNQILHPNLSVAIFAQNGVYAYFSVLFVPIVFGIFLKNVKFVTALSGSLTALIVYFSVYYLFPALLKSGSADFGFFNHYFTGSVQNPAIAASIAILMSFLLGFTVHLTKKKTTIATK